MNPKIDGAELTDRHSAYLDEMRRAWNEEGNRGQAAALIKKAQESYAEWFAERGVDLVFS